MRIGLGIDTHKFIEGKNFLLGGVEIEHNKTIKAHSDGDVLIHSIIDAILGAANLGDIGKLFPDTDEKYKNISSILLLKEVMKQLSEKKYKIENIDSVIILQKPKIAGYIDKMKIVLSTILKINEDQISIKATTSEYMGFIGREEGITVHSVCLLSKR